MADIVARGAGYQPASGVSTFLTHEALAAGCQMLFVRPASGP